MGSRTVKIVGLFLISAILTFTYLQFSSVSTNKEDYKYFLTHCALYNKQGQLVFNFNNNYMCDFHSDGSIVVSNPAEDRVSLYDKSDNMVWTSNENSHHDIRFSQDEKSILSITTEIIKLNNKAVRGDCFIVRNLKNVIEKKWCVADHFDELEKLGIKTGQTIVFAPENKSKIVTMDTEISHSNSFGEIETNARSEIDPVFKKGNYIVNLYLPMPLTLILDRELKKILWLNAYCIDLSSRVSIHFMIHDAQIAPNGQLLSYVNYAIQTDKFRCFNNNFRHYDNKKDFLKLVKLDYNQFENPYKIPSRFYTLLTEIDPYSKHVTWKYRAPNRFQFFSDRFGGVTHLKNNHFLFSDITTKNRVIEIDENGNEVINLELQGFDYPIKSVKPFYKYEFFRSRNIDLKD